MYILAFVLLLVFLYFLFDVFRLYCVFWLSFRCFLTFLCFFLVYFGLEPFWCFILSPHLCHPIDNTWRMRIIGFLSKVGFTPLTVAVSGHFQWPKVSQNIYRVYDVYNIYSLYKKKLNITPFLSTRSKEIICPTVLLVIVLLTWLVVVRNNVYLQPATC